ncbi:MAG: hypothetical protein C0392_01930 [Syntrophus sp. (in: bacteria)]|nr:hypothetical protein [Syntrophus sp. (in: bacteria)]
MGRADGGRMKGYHTIEELLSGAIGLEPESIGMNTIAMDIDSLMKTSRIEDKGLYLKRLMSVPTEMERLIEKVVVPETWFFRDREAFRFLKQYVRESLSINRGEMLKVLSVPCSTGEEPYSIAMTLLEAGVKPEAIHIDAVDISAQAIRTAHSACYGPSSFRGEAKTYQGLYFTPSEGRMQLNPPVAGLVHFYQDNLTRPDFMADYDGSYRIIFCKNLLIYLNPQARQRVFANLNRMLMPGGILFTGHSELTAILQWGYDPVTHRRSFACMKPEGLLLRKIENVTPAPVIIDSHAGESTAGSSYLQAKKNRASSSKLLQAEGATQASFRAFPSELLRAEGVAPTASPVEGATQAPLIESPLITIRRLADIGSLDEALNLCECYLKENSVHKEAYYLMGLINHALNRIERAETFFSKALYLDPSYYEALLHMSLLYDQREETAKAAVFKERIKRLQETEQGMGGNR